MTITIRLTKDEEARLDALSERTGRTKSFYVRTAVREYLEDLEDTYAADAAIRAFEASGRKSRPWSELRAELGVTDDELTQAREELRTVGDL
jgi:RHH-type rel operon transcriptional repressor/antitoxin RelB